MTYNNDHKLKTKNTEPIDDINEDGIHELKKNWYAYVLKTVEKISDTLNGYIEEHNRFKINITNDLHNSTMKLRDKIDQDKKEANMHIETLNDLILSKCEVIDNRISKLESTTANENRNRYGNLKDDLTLFKSEVDKQFQPIRIRIVKLETRLVLWSTLFGMLGSGFIGLLAYVLKDYISKLIAN